MSDEAEIRFMGDLQRLTYKPGDKFVLKCASAISRESVERLKHYFEQFMPGAQVLVLGDGIELGVVGPD